MSNAVAHFHADEYPNAPPAEARFHVIPVPYEGTVSYGTGTAAGPHAILEASSQLEAFDGTDCPGRHGIHTRQAPNCDGTPEIVLSRVREAVASTLEAAAPGRTPPVPVLLGGEHSVTAGAVEAVTAKYGRIGMVQLDAHADLRESYEGTRFSHACVARRVHEDLGVPLLQFGIRALSLEEHNYRTAFTPPRSPAIISHGALELVSLHRPSDIPFDFPADIPDPVYLTVDVDGLDPSVFPATGTPVPGGLGWFQTLALVEWVCAHRTVAAFDVVELAPIPHLHALNYAAAELVYRIMGFVSRSAAPR
ncbi:MAG: agmatinase family protein [bacterium]